MAVFQANPRWPLPVKYYLWQNRMHIFLLLAGFLLFWKRTSDDKWHAIFTSQVPFLSPNQQSSSVKALKKHEALTSVFIQD